MHGPQGKYVIHMDGKNYSEEQNKKLKNADGYIGYLVSTRNPMMTGKSVFGDGDRWLPYDLMIPATRYYGMDYIRLTTADIIKFIGN